MMVRAVRSSNHAITLPRMGDRRNCRPPQALRIPPRSIGRTRMGRRSVSTVGSPPFRKPSGLVPSTIERGGPHRSPPPAPGAAFRDHSYVQSSPKLLAAYVDLQLRLVDRMVGLGLCGIDEAVLRYTNLARRFGIEPQGAPNDDRWQRYVDQLQVLGSLQARVSWTVTFASTVNQTTSPRSPISDGAFSAEIHDGVVRTHFLPSDHDGLSPLHPSRLASRRRELRAVVRRARTLHPEVHRIQGASWLYNTTSYRALFPPAHVRTAAVRTGMTRFQGSSSWGQFLDHRGGVKENLRQVFLAEPEHLRRRRFVAALSLANPCCRLTHRSIRRIRAAAVVVR